MDPDLEPIRWDLKDPQRQTLWGAPAPRSWCSASGPTIRAPMDASSPTMCTFDGVGVMPPVADVSPESMIGVALPSLKTSQ